MHKAFVRFRTAAHTPETPQYHPDIFNLYDNAAVRATLPAEWANRVTDEGAEGHIPVWEEDESQLARYRSYDNAVRDPDLDADD
jgi:hypothetical protein